MSLHIQNLKRQHNFIHNVYDMDFELKNELERSNRLLFEQCFSLENVAKYIQLINSDMIWEHIERDVEANQARLYCQSMDCIGISMN